MKFCWDLWDVLGAAYKSLSFVSVIDPNKMNETSFSFNIKESNYLSFRKLPFSYTNMMNLIVYSKEFITSTGITPDQNVTISATQQTQTQTRV